MFCIIKCGSASKSLNLGISFSLSSNSLTLCKNRRKVNRLGLYDRPINNPNSSRYTLLKSSIERNQTVQNRITLRIIPPNCNLRKSEFQLLVLAPAKKNIVPIKEQKVIHTHMHCSSLVLIDANIFVAPANNNARISEVEWLQSYLLLCSQSYSVLPLNRFRPPSPISICN